MLTGIYTFNFLDRQLLANLTENIKADTGLTDADLGKLGGIYFAAFYTVLGVVVGFLADRGNRLWILSAGSFLWSLFTMAFGMARGLPMMAVTRMGVGVGEAAGAPPSYSIISDYFPARRRGQALAIFSLGVPFGTALGAGAGLMLAKIDTHWVIPVVGIDIYHSWRFPFVLIGALGILATVLMLVIVREPRRGAQDVEPETRLEAAPSTAVDKPGFLATAWAFLSRPMLLVTALSCGATAFVGYAVLNWTTPLLARVKAAPVREDYFILLYACEMAVCMGLGTWLSGVLVDWLSKRSKVWYALVPAIALSIAAPFYVAFIWAPTWQMTLLFLAVPTLLNNTYLAPALAVVQNSVKPEQRTMSGAVLLMILNMIGLGLGPYFIGQLSTNLTLADVQHTLSVTAAEAGKYLTMKADALKALPQVAPVVTTAGKNGLQTALYFLAPFYLLAIGLHIVEAFLLGREKAAGSPVSDGGRLFGFFVLVAGAGVAWLISVTWVGGAPDKMLAIAGDPGHRAFVDALLQIFLAALAATGMALGLTFVARSFGTRRSPG
jgi:MFS family permease